MDALDAQILGRLGIEPFAGFDDRPRGLRAAAVARSLGRNIRLVQDRITRMERAGVITGYAMVPNPRHLGLRLTSLYVPSNGPAGAATLSALSRLDGFVQAVGYLGEGICLNLSHATPEELARRAGTAADLAGAAGPPRAMYRDDLPPVARPLGPLDWRIIRAFAADAKRAPNDVATELGIAPKGLRRRLKRLRDEGSIDEVVRLDLAKMEGLVPFEVAVWTKDKAATERLVEALAPNYWGHFPGPPDGYSDLLLRLFATNVAEVDELVQHIDKTPGVHRCRALMAARAHDDPQWLMEAIQARVAEASDP